MNRSLSTCLAAIAIALGGVCASRADGSPPGSPTTQVAAPLAPAQIQTEIDKLKDVLDKDRRDGQAQLLLGKLYLRLGDGVAATEPLRNALGLGVPASAVVPALAQALLIVGDARAAVELDGQGFPPVAGAELAAIQAMAYIELGDIDRAEAAILEASADGQSLDPMQLARADLAYAKGGQDAAVRALETLLTASPDFGLGWSFLGDIQRRRGNPQAAEAAYSRAIASLYDLRYELVNRALVRVSLGNLDGAASDVAQLRQMQTSSSDVDYAEGLLLYFRGRYAQALELLDKASALRSYDYADFYRGACYVQLGRSESALDTLERFLARHPDDAATRTLIARIAIGNRDFAGAEGLLKPVLAAAKVDPLASSLMAQSLIGQGKSREAIAHLQRLATAEPTSAPALTALAVGELASGESAEGMRDLTEALRLDPGFAPAAIQAIFASVRQDRLDAALDLASAYRTAHPDEAQPYLLLGLVQLRRKDTEQAAAAFQKVLGLDPGNPSANSGLAAIALGQGKLDEAKARYRATLAVHADDLGALLDLSKVAAAQGDRQGQRQLLEEAIRRNPRASAPKLMLARLYAGDGELERAQVILSELASAVPKDAAVQALLGDVQVALKQYEPALATYRHLVELDPKRAAYRLRLARAAELGGDLDEYRAATDAAIALVPDPTAARVALARHALAQGRVQEADAQLAALRAQGQDDADLDLLDGQIGDVARDWARAEPAYRKALSRANNNLTLLRLTNAQWERGARDAVVKSLGEWLQRYPQDVLIRAELGNRLFALGRSADAIAQYEQALDKVPSGIDAVVLNNLAWMLKDTEPKRALGYAERAVAIAPGSLQAKDTLIVTLLANRDLERASATIAAGLASHPGVALILYRQAQLLDAQGKPADARSVLAEALLTDQAFAERPEAQAMFARLRDR